MKHVTQIRAELPAYKYSDYLRNLKAVEESCAEAKPLRVAVLRSYTVEAIEPVLKLRLLLEGFKTEWFFGDYNLYVQEILDTSSPFYAFRPDVVLLMVRIEELMPDFVEEFGSRSFSEWEANIQSKAREIGDLAKTIQRSLAAQFIVQNVCLPAGLYWGVYDTQNPQGQTYLVSRFNQTLAEALREVKGAFIWDFNRFVQKKGYDHIFDSKMWFLSKNPYRQSVYPWMVDDLLRYLLSILGKSKKCIVLDLDNTLWGGIVGEDGIKGIHLGHAYPGNCFRAFQQELLKLHHRGVLLAVNSKNNEADALEVIDTHPDMVLRRKHFSAIRINWEDKASNMKALAEELNIGVDSMIMIDDNPIECEQIHQLLPECDVICLPGQPYLIQQVFDVLPGIENIRLTDEDKKKGEMYQAQIARKQHERTYGNLDDFLKSLELEVGIQAAVPFSIPRIAQLTQKTNQMNLTTRRYTEADIAAMVNDSNTFVFSVSSKDKFGDNGIVGVVILKLKEEECLIDTFLLSCRVIGRNIEGAMIAVMSEFARGKGAGTLLGEYLQTTKNKPARDMFERFQFDKFSETLYRADLCKRVFEIPSYIRVAIDIPDYARHC
jgi:FkbH-like protein